MRLTGNRAGDHGAAVRRDALMRSWPLRTRKASRIEIIPMIDVMMFLLVFFVLISINALPALRVAGCAALRE